MNGDPLAFIPLIFDRTDSLYFAEGCNAALAAAHAGSEPVDGDVYLTDYDTFIRVIGETSRRAGGSYEHLCADGNTHRAKSVEVGTARRSGAPDGVIYDPY